MPKVFLSPSNQYDNRYAYGGTTEGVQCGKIAEAHGGVIGMTGPGFIDPGGTGNGGH